VPGRPDPEQAVPPVMWVQDTEGRKVPLPGVFVAVVAAQAAQQMHGIARAAVRDELCDCMAALGALLVSTFTRPAAEAGAGEGGAATEGTDGNGEQEETDPSDDSAAGLLASAGGGRSEASGPLDDFDPGDQN
jgi:hypothetical protein